MTTLTKSDLKAAQEKASQEGSLSAICWVLGFLCSNGDCCSTYYEEIVSAFGVKDLVAFARKNNEMRFTGLNKYLKRLKEIQELTP